MQAGVAERVAGKRIPDSAVDAFVWQGSERVYVRPRRAHARAVFPL